MARSLLPKATVALVFALLFLAHGVLIGAVSQQRVPNDFSKFYASARFLLEGGDIYGPVAIDAFGPIPNPDRYERPIHHPNLNLPAFTVLFAPLALLPYETASLVWMFGSLLAGVAACLFITMSHPRLRQMPGAWLLMPTALLVYYPTIANQLLGQVSLYLLLLLMLVWSSARKRWFVAAGILLGIALTLKVFVGLLVLFFLARRQWRVVVWCGLTFGVLAVAGLFAAGFDAYTTYREVMRSITWFATNWNASFLGFTSRFFGGSEHQPLINAPAMAHLLANILGVAAGLGAVGLSAVRRHALPVHFDLAFSLCVCVMLLVSPLGWMYYFPLLVLPVTILLACERPSSSWKMRGSLLAGVALTTIPLPLVGSEQLNDPVAWLTWASLNFYGLLIISAVTARQTHQAARAEGRWMDAATARGKQLSVSAPRVEGAR